MARGSFRRRSTRSWRPGTDWAAATMVGSLTAGVGGTDADVWDLSAISEDAPTGTDVHEMTVRRTRGVWHCYPVTWPSSTPGVVEVAIGIGIGDPDAGMGVDPIDDAYWDGWLFRKWTYFRLPAPVSPFSSGSFSNAAVTGGDALWTIDSRAMRKLGDSPLMLVASLATDTGVAVVVNYVVDLRWLTSLTPKG